LLVPLDLLCKQSWSDKSTRERCSYFIRSPSLGC